MTANNGFRGYNIDPKVLKQIQYTQQAIDRFKASGAPVLAQYAEIQAMASKVLTPTLLLNIEIASKHLNDVKLIVDEKLMNQFGRVSDMLSNMNHSHIEKNEPATIDEVVPVVELAEVMSNQILESVTQTDNEMTIESTHDVNEINSETEQVTDQAKDIETKSLFTREQLITYAKSLAEKVSVAVISAKIVNIDYKEYFESFIEMCNNLLS
ncbi:hypothetical protein MKY95_19435 [Paenibacillus sp. FSL P4-0176]|uniref:hypothetical protein n=1 Tax=Paenibacillus sp. FSL P4-0176 TaxID=2921631 RepID=UPI0030CBBDC2